MVHKILVPLDGSEMAESALPIAREMAATNQAEIVLFHSDYPEELSTISEIEQAERANAIAYLMATGSRELARGSAVTTAMLDGITAADAILAYSDRNDVDVIVMSTHGRSAAANALLGSTAARVAQESPIQVMLVYPFQPDAAGAPTVARADHRFSPS